MQITMEQIREDLKDIQYYYGNEKAFLLGARTVGVNNIVGKISKYNELVCRAPIRLYHIYIELYINNNTQMAVAEDMNCSAENIKRINGLLCQFLFEQLNKEEQ